MISGPRILNNLQLQAIALVLLTVLSAASVPTKSASVSTSAASVPTSAASVLKKAASVAAETHEFSTPALQILHQLQFPTEQKRQFIEQQFNPMLKTPIESRGTVWITIDQTMVMELSQPRPEQRRLRGAELSLSRPRVDSTDSSPDFSRVNHRLTLKSNKPSHLILLAAGALLQGDHQWVTDHFNLSFAPREADWEILMVPSAPALRQKLPWIRLTGTGDTLTGLRADRGADGWQELLFFPPAAANQ